MVQASKGDPYQLALLIGVALYYIYYITNTIVNYEPVFDTSSKSEIIMDGILLLTAVLMPFIYYLLLKNRQLGWIFSVMQLLMSFISSLLSFIFLGMILVGGAAVWIISLITALQLLLLILLFSRKAISTYNIPPSLRSATIGGAMVLLVILGLLFWVVDYF